MQKQVFVGEALAIYRSWCSVHHKLLNDSTREEKNRLLYEERSLERAMQQLSQWYLLYRNAIN